MNPSGSHLDAVETSAVGSLIHVSEVWLLVEVELWRHKHLQSVRHLKSIHGALQEEAVRGAVQLCRAIKGLEHTACHLFTRGVAHPPRLVLLKAVSVRVRPRVCYRALAAFRRRVPATGVLAPHSRGHLDSEAR